MGVYLAINSTISPLASSVPSQSEIVGVSLSASEKFIRLNRMKNKRILKIKTYKLSLKSRNSCQVAFQLEDSIENRSTRQLLST